MGNNQKLSNLARAAEALYMRAWEHMRDGEPEKAEELAHLLLQNPRLGPAHVAGMHRLLAHGQDDYVNHAKEAVRLYKEMIEEDEKRIPPPLQSLNALRECLQKSEKLLEKALQDEKEIDGKFAKATAGMSDSQIIAMQEQHIVNQIIAAEEAASQDKDEDEANTGLESGAAKSKLAPRQLSTKRDISSTDEAFSENRTNIIKGDTQDTESGDEDFMPQLPKRNDQDDK